MEKSLVTRFRLSVKAVARGLGKHPRAVTKSDYFLANVSTLSEWEIRKVGGFRKMMDTCYPAKRQAVLNTVYKLIGVRNETR